MSQAGWIVASDRELLPEYHPRASKSVDANCIKLDFAETTERPETYVTATALPLAVVALRSRIVHSTETAKTATVRNRTDDVAAVRSSYNRPPTEAVLSAGCRDGTAAPNP
jgi:hypothetical protein